MQMQRKLGAINLQLMFFSYIDNTLQAFLCVNKMLLVCLFEYTQVQVWILHKSDKEWQAYQ